MTVARLRREMPSRELRQWIAYYKKEAADAEKRRKQAEAKRAVRSPRRRR